MKILLFGVSNVGKITAGCILSDRLGYKFYDLDSEIKKYYGITLEEFVHTGTLMERDWKRGEMIGKLLDDDKDKVIAITPMSHPEYFEKYLRQKDVLAIELIDSPENIFDRLVFSDENDVIYRDDDYKDAHRNYYMKEICEDLKWYGRCYRSVKNKINVNNDSPEVVVDRIIIQYGLTARN